MEDTEFTALRIRASICPGMETEWEKPETAHWIALHKFGNEQRDHIGKALVAIEAAERDKKLSPEGKRSKQREIATKALSELETASLAKARESVAAQMATWDAKVAAHIKPAQDQTEAILHASIRQKVAEMKEGRMAFLQKHANDPVVAGALLSAPGFLSGLGETELLMLRHEVDKQFLSPEVIEARGKITKALQEAERALLAGQAMIRKAVGLSKPTAAELAMARLQQEVA